MHRGGRGGGGGSAGNWKTAGKGEADGKATVVAVLGVDLARAHAEGLADQAADHLEGFGEKAALLRDLAAYVVQRRS